MSLQNSNELLTDVISAFFSSLPVESVRDIRASTKVGDWDGLYPKLAKLAQTLEEQGRHLRPTLRPIAEVDEVDESDEGNSDDDSDSDGTVVGRRM